MADHPAGDLLSRVTILEATVRRQRAERTRHHARRLRPLLVAALLTALAPLATLAATPFTDLNPGSPHNANINLIAAAGITTGCDPGVAYCPNGNVTREEMASFLARAAGLGNNPPVANALTAQTATTATSAQNAARLGGEPAASYVRTSTPLLPIAFATVNDDGTRRSGTANVTTARLSTGVYQVTIAGVAYSDADYTTLVTQAGTMGMAWAFADTGRILVSTADVTGVTALNRPFNLVVYRR